ncbi:MAG TPA: MmgE/PrpD family protein [Actinophytocola sp.]|jgi:2-methylcitrate dehydratase PrpD|nr:MmgE/PrpD family protein [Actinophytocola sp.]
MSLSTELADYCVSTRYEALPAAAVFRAKCVLLDELCCMVLGQRLPAGELLSRYVASLGGRPEATVAGTGIRAPRAFAALANGTAGHADELDGAHITEGHPGATLVATGLAMGEQQASGRELLNALVLGYDLATRLVDTVGGRYHLLTSRHVHTDFLHAFGAAAVAGRLLGLPADRYRHAWALTACQAISLAAFFEEREHLSKSFTYGHGAYAGVTAAVLAELGMEGNDDVFGAKHGVLAAWGGQDRADVLLAGLGTDFAIMDVNFKFYSAGYPIHAQIEATLGLMRDHGLRTADVVGIDVRATTECVEVVDGRRMASISAQVMLPVAMIAGKLGFAEAHNEDNLRDPEVKRLGDTITLTADAEMDRENHRGRGAAVTLRTTDGRALSRHVRWPHGHCRAGDVTWDELVGKCHDMVDEDLGPDRVDELAETIAGLDGVRDLSELTRLLVPRT